MICATNGGRFVLARRLSSNRILSAQRRQQLYYAGRLLDKTSPYLTRVSLDDYLGSVGCARDVAEGYDITHLAAGHDYALIAYRTRDRNNPRERVFAIGNNTVGQLGLEYNSHEMTKGMVNLSQFSEEKARRAEDQPISPPEKSNRNGQILQLAAGRETSFLLLLRSNGQTELLSWGGSALGSSGLGLSTQGINNNKAKDLTTQARSGRSFPVTPSPLLVPIDAQPLIIHAGLDHSILRTSTGLFSTGWNADGQLGRDTTAPHESTHFEPLESPFEHHDIVSVSSVADHTLVLLKNGEIFSWGNSEYGQCMTGSRNHRQVKPILTSLSLPHGRSARAVGAGGSFSLVLDDTGVVHACGRGALGLGFRPEDLESLELRPLPCTGITRISTSVHYAVLINDEKGTVHVIGANSQEGVLAIGPSLQSTELPPHAFLPSPVVLPSAEGRLCINKNTMIATGGDCMLVVTET